MSVPEHFLNYIQIQKCCILKVNVLPKANTLTVGADRAGWWLAVQGRAGRYTAKMYRATRDVKKKMGKVGGKG